MKNLLRIFVLTKSEQRIVLVILVVLLVAMVTKHYRGKRPQVSPSATPSISTLPAHGEEELATTDDGS
jgi:hypothetical protein